MSKSVKSTSPKAPEIDARKVSSKKPGKPLSEQVIKEIMIQKSVDRETAINILQNPTPHPEKS